jgi:hypothetical protein
VRGETIGSESYDNGPGWEVPTKPISSLDGWVATQLPIVDSAANTVEETEVTEAIALWAIVLAAELKLIPAEVSSWVK